MTTMRFFMIGSWTEGMVHFNKLIPYIIASETAYIISTAYRLAVGYPVLVDFPNSVESLELNIKSKIAGQLIEIKMDSTLLNVLDFFHGVNLKDFSKGLYHRKECKVFRSYNEEVLAHVYFFNPKKLNKKSQLIKNGDWKQSLQIDPPIIQNLTDRQKDYVLQLGSVKGRDIVPIKDLTLYRELMKLELIVDKGRRLALSPFGKEVYSYLS